MFINFIGRKILFSHIFMQKKMNYNEVLNYLYTQLPMFQRIGAAAYKADLKNILSLCEKLNHPEKKLKFVHIAGTNGKGSVSNMLAAVFQQNGYKTGLFTSPHLTDFRERIRINGKMISKPYITRFVNTYKHIFDDIQPSFFEWTTILAFQYFYEKKADIVILETGMGGRLDSTNVVIPELSIITNIGEDHKQFLGDTIPKIAFEKAGIIKENVPVLISEYQKETHPVFEETSRHKNAPLLYAKNIVSVCEFHQTAKFLELSYKINYTYLIKKLDYSKLNKNTNLKKIFDKSNLNFRNIKTKNLDLSKNKIQKVKSPLNAVYQVKNISCVLAACEILQCIGWHLRPRDIRTAIQNTPQLTGFQGRWQIIQTKPYIVLDIAHNKQGILSALQNLKRYSYHTLRIVFGVAKDKEVDEILRLLPKNALYYITQASVPRAMPAEMLYEKMSTFKLKSPPYPTVSDAVVSALQDARKNDFILVFGSAFVVADALAYFNSSQKQ